MFADVGSKGGNFVGKWSEERYNQEYRVAYATLQTVLATNDHYETCSDNDKEIIQQLQKVRDCLTNKCTA